MNLDDVIKNEYAYKEKFGAFPEMPHRMPMSEFNDLIVAALESGEPIDTSFDPDVLS